jgi:hypothetical protein
VGEGALKEVRLIPDGAGDEEVVVADIGEAEEEGEMVVQAEADEESPPCLKLFFLMGAMRPRRKELSRRCLGDAVEASFDRCSSSTHAIGAAGCCCWG